MSEETDGFSGNLPGLIDEGGGLSVHFGPASGHISSDRLANWHRSSPGLAIGSLREEIEVQVSDLLGPSAYFRMIRNRVVNQVKTFERRLESGAVRTVQPTPVYKENAAKAKLSAGFNKLNGALNKIGYQATLESDDATGSYPCLNLKIEGCRPA